MIIATDVSPVQMPIARPRAVPSNSLVMIASDEGTSRAPATPWMPRAMTRNVGSGAAAIATDASPNSTSPTRRMRMRPNASDSDPATRMSAPRVTR